MSNGPTQFLHIWITRLLFHFSLASLYFSTIFPNCISQLYFSSGGGGCYPGYQGCCSICPTCPCISQLYFPIVFPNCISQLEEEDAILDILGLLFHLSNVFPYLPTEFLICISHIYFSTRGGGCYPGYRGCCSICPLCPSWHFLAATISPSVPTLQSPRGGDNTERTQHLGHTNLSNLVLVA